MLRSDSYNHRNSRLSENQQRQPVGVAPPCLPRATVGVIPPPRQHGATTGGLPLQIAQLIFGTFIGTLINSLLLPATAQTVQLGIVKSPENTANWSGITSRLQSTGVSYCVVDFAQVRQAKDLGNTQLLFLPNIERLEPAQLQALQDWMNQGGRIIASGAMGTLSQPEVRSQLRSLLGAYWGFALTKPSGLAAVRINKQNWVQGAALGNPIQGGVVIPAGLNSTTAAVWSQSDNNPPAIVTTEKTTFFGWNWGNEQVAPAAIDSAWLKAALSRYGVTATQANNPAPQQFCLPSQAAAANLPVVNTTPAKPTTPVKVAQTEPDFGVVPIQVQPNQTGSLSAREVTAMTQELENLIGRFESAFFGGECH